jgi:hypothetical protein
MPIDPINHIDHQLHVDIAHTDTNTAHVDTPHTDTAHTDHAPGHTDSNKHTDVKGGHVDVTNKGLPF